MWGLIVSPQRYQLIPGYNNSKITIKILTMLTQLVRPLVRIQIQILANSKKAGGDLVATITRWLGYLGVQAKVKQLRVEGSCIQVSLSVGKPEQCSLEEWQRILEKLETGTSMQPLDGEIAYQTMNEMQQRKSSRLLAYIIQVGNPSAIDQWDSLQEQLTGLGMESELLASIYAALKVPQFLDSLLDNLEPEVAAFVLTRAIGIAFIDKKITMDEDSALKKIYSALGSLDS